MLRSLAAGLWLVATAAFGQVPEPRPQVMVSGLEHPWGLAQLPDGNFLVTERPGRLRLIKMDEARPSDSKVGLAIAGLPPIDAGGQGGLLDIWLDNDFANNRRLYFCFTEPGRSALGSSGNSTALARATLSADATKLEGIHVLFSQKPKFASRLHFGCRIAQTANGDLYLTLGDRFSRMRDAQTLDTHHGKVIRIRPDGSVPPDNPFVGRAGALPEIYSFGHRNMQGATIGPDGKLWTHEHGPQGGDEINIIAPGKNYGWPTITYGENYGGGKIGEGITAKEGLEQPLYKWVPSIAPSGMVFLTSERYNEKYGRAWQGSLFVGALRAQTLVRLNASMNPQGKLVISGEQRLLRNFGERIRDVRQGANGLLYLLTDSDDGKLVRLDP